MPRIQAPIQKPARLRLNGSIEFGQAILRLPALEWSRLARVVRSLFTWVERPVRGLARMEGALDRIEAPASEIDRLREYRLQAALLDLETDERRLLESAIDLLEPDGSLSEETSRAFAGALARAAGRRVSPAEAGRTLRHLHAFDPPAGWANPVDLLLILHRRSEDYRPGDAVERLLRKEPLDKDEWTEATERVKREIAPCVDRSIWKPGRNITRPASPAGPAEIRFVVDGQALRVTDPRGEPIVRHEFHALNPKHLEGWMRGSLDPRTRRALTSFLMGVVRSGRYRLETLRIIAESVIPFQRAHLLGRRAHPAPMTYQDVAEATGMSRSVICRAVKGKAFIDPSGTERPFRSLFSGKAKVSHRREGEIDRASVIDEIRRIVEAEDPARPLFDVAIAAELARRGVAMSLSGVRKYRRLAGIEPRARRR